MNDIFIEIYLDEDVNVLVAELIRPHGFKASSATDAGRKGKSDAEQLKFASAQKMSILTHNRRITKNWLWNILLATRLIMELLLLSGARRRKSLPGF